MATLSESNPVVFEVIVDRYVSIDNERGATHTLWLHIELDDWTSTIHVLQRTEFKVVPNCQRNLSVGE